MNPADFRYVKNGFTCLSLHVIRYGWKWFDIGGHWKSTGDDLYEARTMSDEHLLDINGDSLLVFYDVILDIAVFKTVGNLLSDLPLMPPSLD